MEQTPTEGQTLPELALPDQDGHTRNLGDLAGPKGLVLYTYPKDDTPGCTLEAKDFRDILPELRERGFELAGLSVDRAPSHCEFADKYDLTFPLLSDPEGTYAKKLGVWSEIEWDGKRFPALSRATWVVAPDGEVLKAYPKVHAQGHARQVLADVDALG